MSGSTRVVATAQYDAAGKRWIARLCVHTDGRKAGLYYADYFVPLANGRRKRLRPYLGTRTEAEAMTRFHMHLRENVPLEVAAALEPEPPPSAGKLTTLAALFQYYTDTVQVARGNEPETRRKNSVVYQRFLDFCARWNVRTVADLTANPSVATAYLAERATVRKANTVRHECFVLQAAFRAALADRRIPALPVNRWNMPAAEESEYPVLLTREEFQRLLDRMAARGSLHLNVIRFLGYTGLRPVDACALKRQQVRLDTRVIQFRQQKTSKPTALAMSEPAAQAIRDELARGVESEYVFTGRHGRPLNPKSVANTMRYHSHEAGLRVLSPRQCRVYVVSHAIAKGYDAEYVKAVSGHDSPAIRKYIRRVERVAHGLADAIADTLTRDELG